MWIHHHTTTDIADSNNNNGNNDKRQWKKKKKMLKANIIYTTYTYICTVCIHNNNNTWRSSFLRNDEEWAHTEKKESFWRVSLISSKPMKCYSTFYSIRSAVVFFFVSFRFFSLLLSYPSWHLLHRLSLIIIILIFALSYKTTERVVLCHRFVFYFQFFQTQI